MIPIFFKNQYDFRNWLDKNHNKEAELLVGFYKKGSGKQNMTWSQSVDEALCYGWIDGVRKSIDDNSYCIRFTPRRSTSIWSEVNIKKVEQLTKQGLMQKVGLDAFQNRKEERSKVYSFEDDIKELSNNLENKFKLNKKAWDFFTSRTPSYKKTIIHWIMSAKQESTKFSRLDKTIAESEKQSQIWDKYK